MESVGISRVLGRTHSGYPFTHKTRKGELKICAGYKGSRVLDRYMNKHEHEVHHSEPRWATERVETGKVDRGQCAKDGGHFAGLAN